MWNKEDWHQAASANVSPQSILTEIRHRQTWLGPVVQVSIKIICCNYSSTSAKLRLFKRYLDSTLTMERATHLVSPL